MLTNTPGEPAVGFRPLGSCTVCTAPAIACRPLLVVVTFSVTGEPATTAVGPERVVARSKRGAAVMLAEFTLLAGLLSVVVVVTAAVPVTTPLPGMVKAIADDKEAPPPRVVGG